MATIFDDPSARLMYQSALQNFASGYVGPLEKEVLSHSPLPNEFIDEYISQSLEVKSMMKETYFPSGSMKRKRQIISPIIS